MGAKRKAAFPFKARNLGKTASENCRNNTTNPSKRQQLKRIIVWLAVAGILPIAVAEWIIQWGGLADV